VPAVPPALMECQLLVVFDEMLTMMIQSDGGQTTHISGAFLQ
jgi:hypothetical protein